MKLRNGKLLGFLTPDTMILAMSLSCLVGAGVFSVAAGVIKVPGTLSRHQVSSIDIPVVNSADDAWENGRGQTSSNSKDLLVNSYRNTAHYNYVATGLRFRSVDIPQGAEVTNAYVKLFVPGRRGGRDEANLRVYAEAVDDAADFITDPHILSRQRTAASVVWVARDMGFSGYKKSPTLKQPLAEIFARSGWAAGNDLVLLLVPNDGVKKSMRFSARDNNLDHPPKLHIEYKISTPVSQGGPLAP